jgi:hypothetical protein
MSRTAGLVRADGEVVTTAAASDKVVIQKLDSNSGQYEPRVITVGNLLTGGGTSFTAGSVIFAGSSGDLDEDNTNFFFNDATNTLRITNIDAGASGTAGSIDIFPTTASKGKIALAATANTNNDTLTITNAAYGQATTLTIPDVGGASASFVMTAGTQTIAGVKTFSSVPLGTSDAVCVYVPVISAQAGAVSVLFSAPFSGTITKIYASISGAIITSDIVITPSVYNAGSGTAVTNGVVTVPFTASGVGTTALATPSAANTFVAGDAITATITGGVNAVNGVITLLITRTA